MSGRAEAVEKLVFIFIKYLSGLNVMLSGNRVAKAFPKNASIRNSTLQELAKDNRLYVIFIIARSGSTWLMELAENSTGLGTPQEWFNEGWIYETEPALGCRPPRLVGTPDVEAYIQKTVTDYRSADRVMGVQLSPYQTECLCEMLEDPVAAMKLVTPFYLRRRNIVAQAISLYRSVQSGFFHSYQQEVPPASFDEVPYDAKSIASWCEHLVTGEIFFESVFDRLAIRPARFMYEDILADSARTLTWMRRQIVPDCHVALPARSEKMTPIGKQKNVDWALRFTAENSDVLSDLQRRRPAMVSSFG